MKQIFERAQKNQDAAWKVIQETDVVGIWERAGARVNLVGSLKTGLLMKHRDIDFHVYTDTLSVARSFSIVQQLAAHPGIGRIEYINLLDTEEECIEWHAWYEDRNQDVWQLDMIHLRKGSTYDGAVEKVTAGILNRLTPETKASILRIKYELSETSGVTGIEIYRAVLSFGVRTLPEFLNWRETHPPAGVFGWMP